MASRLLRRRGIGVRFGDHLIPSPAGKGTGASSGLVRRLSTSPAGTGAVTQNGCTLYRHVEDGRPGYYILAYSITAFLIPASHMVWRKLQIIKETAELEAAMEVVDQEIQHARDLLDASA